MQRRTLPPRLRCFFNSCKRLGSEMAYSPGTDLLGLLRQTSGGMRSVRMPGMDYILVALARANMFVISVEPTPPVEEQAVTVWLRPASPSWATEGDVFLWNTNTGEYEPATFELWAALFIATAPADYVFQAVTTGAATIADTTTLLAIERAAPVLTILSLPSVFIRANRALRIADWSIGAVNHEIDLNAADGETIMRLGTFKLFSTADQSAGVTLYPSADLDGWVIAP
jgi:hypothetical protein